MGFVISCKKEENTNLDIHFILKNNNENVVYNKTYKSIKNRNFTVEKFKMYISDFSFLDMNGNTFNIDKIFLVNNDSKFSIVLPDGAKEFNTISFSVGIDSFTNNTINPLLLPEDDVLSLNNDMFWDMTRYRFLLWEGTYDNSVLGTSTPSSPYSFHIGRDRNLRKITLTNNINLAIDNNIDLSLDINQLFYNASDTLDFLTTFSNHSNDSELEEAAIIMNNLSQSFTIE